VITLKGNTHPLASAEFDQGPVDDALSGRMLLVLKRSPEQDIALRQLVEEQVTAGSPNFHKWLTAEQFGQQFGVADADIQTLTTYLSAHGFTIGRIYKNRSAIEITGTAAQLRETFHTQIHSYSIHGKQYYANASDPQIPAALAPVVAGFASLNNIRESELNAKEPKTIQATFDPKSHKLHPEYTGNIDGSTYIVTPSDLQTIYSMQVTTSSPGAGGSGVTVGVVGDSQIDLSLVTAYQSATSGGATSTPTEIVDGDDPSILTTGTDAAIAYEQLELIGAAAPYANLYYYVSATTTYDTGLDFAIIRAVEDDEVSILTIGFQSCEATAGASLNYFIAAAWEEAAAQGMTVVAAAGDSGSAGCDAPASSTSTKGLAVNGYASTPYDTAVGGTDFYYGPSGASNAGTYWSTTNNADYGSAKGYIPEQAWNDSYTSTDSSAGTAMVYGGGGGYSTVGNVAADGVTTSPYPLPSWQTGFATGARSIPDVSFFAGNNYNLAQYAFCTQESQCNITGSSVTLTLGGGTAAAAGVFAGIMAEVVQKYGAQGNANLALYGMYSTTGVFNDATVGYNAPACTAGTGCSGGYLKSSGIMAYPAKIGYDQATGLGSINASTLVSKWTIPAKTASTTTLAIKNSSGTAVTSAVHGTALNIVADVTGSGVAPTGFVSFTTGIILPSDNGLATDPIVNGVAASYGNYFLPGGSYNVTARYAGDANYTSSTATAPITITPEPSRVIFPTSAPASPTSGSSVPFGTVVQVTAEPFSMSNNNVSVPSGTLSVFDNGGSYPFLLMPVGSEGAATYSSALLAVGSHSLVFGYSGDPSFQPSTSAAYKVTVTQVPSTTTLSANATSATTNAPITLTAVIQPVSGSLAAATGVAPTGSVTFSTSSTAVTLVPGFSTAGLPISVATTQVTAAELASAGTTVTATYSGDTNYATSNSSVKLSSATSSATGTNLTLSASPTTVAENGTLTLTAQAASASAAFSCQVSYTVTNQYPNGFQTAITIYNTSSTAISNWTLAFAFANGQQITEIWNATDTQSGANVSITNMSYNGTIAAGGSYNGMGFLGSWNNVTNATPTSFSVNGTTCSSGTGTSSLAGTVQLYANGVSTGDSFPVNSSGAGTYTVPLVNGYLPFSSGNVTLTGVYTPTLTGYASSSAAAAITVTDNRTPADFSISTDTTTKTISPSSSNVYFQLELTSIANFAGTNNSIALSCSVPANSNLKCTPGVTNTTIGTSGIAITTLEISGYPTVNNGALKAPAPQQHWWLVGGGTTLACVFLLGIPARRKGWQGMIAVLICTVLVSSSVIGCGNSSLSSSALESGALGGSGGGGGHAGANYAGGIATNDVAPGTYNVVVTGTATVGTGSTSATLIHNTQVTVVVTTTPVLSSGTYTMTNLSSQLLMTDPNDSTTSGTQIEQYAAINGAAYQQWIFTYLGNGYYTIQSAANPTLYVTDPGSQDSTSPYTVATLQTAYASTDTTNYPTQLWTFDLLSGGYQIISAASGGVLDDDAFGATNGTPVLVYPPKNITDGDNQTWYIN
jgi:subtilase family serine protease